MGGDTDPKEASSLHVADKWADRIPKYAKAFGVICGAVGLAYAGFAAYALPHVRVIASPVWLVVSLLVILLGYRRFRASMVWRFTCTICAVVSLGVWGYSLIGYQIRHHTQEAPHYYYTIEVGSVTPPEQEADPDKIRQEERERTEARLRAEYTKWGKETLELIATWLWLLSSVLWLLTLVYGISEIPRTQTE